MSTVVVSNIHLESTGNNRIQTQNSNVSIYQAGQLLMTANSSEMTVNYNNSIIPVVSTLNNEQSLNYSYSIGDILTTFNDSQSSTPPNFVEANTVLTKSAYPALVSLIGNTSLDVTRWYNRTRSNANVNYGVVYGNNIFVAVGGAGVIQTSTDGIAWTSQTRANTQTQLAIAYGNNTYVSTGLLGSVQNSTDGITWTNRTRAIANQQYGVAYGNGVFVTVGSNTSVQRSTDNGNTWSNATGTTVTASIFNGVIYEPTAGWFVAVADDYRIFTSPDGNAWTARTTTSSNFNLLSVAYGNGMYVASGFYSTGSDGFITRSTDGITWTAQLLNDPSVGANNISLDAVIYADGKFIVGGNTGFVAYSTDAVVWNSVTTPNDKTIRDFAFDGETLIAVGGATTIVNDGTFISTLAKKTEFMVYTPYSSTDTNIKTYVRAV